MRRTDLDSHHIEGFARAALEQGKDGRFSVPLISHVDGNLWQGGCVDGVHLPEDFDYVVSLYPWEQYILGPKTERFEYKMYDSTDQGFEQVDTIAAQVVDFVTSGKTLVHCQAGLNRSGLISARALILGGMDPAAAIALLRDKRSPAVLCNQAFERWLLTLEAGR